MSSVFLADDDEVDVVGTFAGQRGLDAGEQFHRAKVDVLVEAEPQVEEQAFFEDARRDVGMPHGAQQDSPIRFKLVEHGGRQDLAGSKIALSTEIEVLHFIADALQGRDGLGKTLTASAVTSGPVPSPPTTAIRRMSLLLTFGFPQKRIDGHKAR